MDTLNTFISRQYNQGITNMLKIIQSALTLSFIATGSTVYAASVDSITITGGYFSIGQHWSTASSCTDGSVNDFNSCKTLIVGTANTLNAGDTGTHKADTSPIDPNIVNFNFFGYQATTGLAPSANGSPPANDWSNGFQGTVGSGTISLNLGGWLYNWNGTNVIQGTDSTGANGTSTAAVGTTGPGNTFTVDWQFYHVGGPTADQTSYWTITGTYTEATSQVPVPAAVWLMGSGLLGLVGVARLRKAA